MCLVLNKQSDRKTRRFKNYKPKNKRKTYVYKVVRPIEQKGLFYSIFFTGEYILGKPAKSDRQRHRLSGLEKEMKRVSNGLYVFLTPKFDQESDAYKYLRDQCGEYGEFAILKCEVNRKSLIAIGGWDSKDGPPTTVFSKMKPVKVVKRFTI